MSESVIVAFITGILALIGTAITVKEGNSKITQEIHEHNAVQDEQIKELTREVRKHNEFAERVPRIELKIETLEKEVEKLREGAK